MLQLKITRKRLLLLAFIFSTAVINAQRGSVHWGQNDSIYYTAENNAIVQYTLPSFHKKEIVPATLLTPRNTDSALRIENFSFSKSGKYLLIYTNSQKVWRLRTRGDYWILDMESQVLHKIGKGLPASSLMFAKISPDERQVAYVSGHNIYTENINGSEKKQLTTDGTSRMINGTFDWVYEEEFGCRDGFRWSPDSKHIAYWHIDARNIKNFLLIDNTDSLYSFVKPVEYPKAGQEPSACQIGVVDIASKKTTWMDIPGDNREHYVPRMEWADNNSELILEQLNRKQNDAKVMICNISTGNTKTIYEEKDSTWIDVKDRWADDPTGWEWFNNGKDFLWVSEKDGWRHIYDISRDGSKQTLLTKGNYDMIRFGTIDKKNGYVYFLASPNNAIQQYLYRVPLNGSGELELISPEAQKGTHTYELSPQASFAMHHFSNHLYQSVTEWVSLPAHRTIKEISAGRRNNIARTQYPIELFQVTTDDGVTMDGWMIKPKNFDSTKKYPVLFHVYAEPAGTTVKDDDRSAGTSLYAGDIAADGYIQISVEGRGTPVPKGAEWRHSIYGKIGTLNIHDQAMAAKKIMQWPFVDTGRIAVYGWSGGGSTTLNLLFQYPDIYKTGIAIAPVANQLLYDNIYEERYMGLPQENMQAYIDCSPLTHAKNLKGNLLVIHGTGDDNVHYQGTEMLINELVKDDKTFQMMSYPNRTHAINEGPGTSLHLSHLFTSYLKEHCPGGGR